MECSSFLSYMNRIQVLGSDDQKNFSSRVCCSGKVSVTRYCSEMKFYISSKDSSLPFQWSSINELDKLPSLRALQCNNNPFVDTEKNPETLKQLIIAKISHLEVLNNCEVCDTSTNCISLAKTLNHCLRNCLQFLLRLLIVWVQEN